MNENYNTPNSGCCGRPMNYSTGPKCEQNHCCFNEYDYKMKACIKNKTPDCTSQAVIPSTTIESTEGLSCYKNALVHVTSTNTTYYMDESGRPLITWAGPMNIPGYDFKNNPNHYKNQIVTDVESKNAAIYDNNGIGFVFAITDGNIQEAVNEKLEEMAEDGTLQELLESFASDEFVFGFDTVGEMKASTALSDGSFVKTMGYHSKEDGGGASYKITNIEPSGFYETISTGLYAELISPTNVKQFGAYGDNTHDDSAAIQAAIDSGIDVYFPKAKYKLSSSISISSKTHWLMDGREAEFNYDGDSYAFILRHVIYCTFDFGIVNALNGGCVAILGDKSGDYSQYNNFKFTEFSALTDCFHVESNNTCWISENRLTNGRFHAGENGLYAMQNSSNGMSHWVIYEIGIEGVNTGFNLNVGETAPDKGINMWEIYAIRHDESIKMFKVRGKAHNFLITTPKRIVENKFDLDSGAHLWKIVSSDRNTYIYNGVLWAHAIDVTDNIVYTQDFYGDSTNVAIEQDYFSNVMITDNIAIVNISIYGSSKIEDAGSQIVVASGFPKPKSETVFASSNYDGSAAPRFKLYENGVLRTYWANNKVIGASGKPCTLSFSYPISDMES